MTVDLSKLGKPAELTEDEQEFAAMYQELRQAYHINDLMFAVMREVLSIANDIIERTGDDVVDEETLELANVIVKTIAEYGKDDN